MLGFNAVSETPICALSDELSFQQQTVTARYATRSFSTYHTDNPADTFIEGRVASGLRLGRRLVQADGGQFGATIETVFGDIELVNSDGALDPLVDQFYADGRAIRLKVGNIAIDEYGREVVKSFSTFGLIYTTAAGEWTFEHDIVRLKISDLSNRLQDQLQQFQIYTGAGGKAGTAEMAGKTRPMAFGECNNVTAQLVDPLYLTYQVHGGSVKAINTVYDSGIPVPIAINHTTYENLVASTVAPGECATCIAEGFFRLGTTPGGVTADVMGDNQPFDARTYTDTHAGVLKKILINYSGLGVENLDVASFTALDTVQPSKMGIFLPAGDQSSIESVLSRVAFSAGAFVGQDRSGLYRVKRLDAPLSTPSWSFDDRTIVAIEREPLPFTVPWKAWGVGYQVNWTVQDTTDLALGVLPARRQFLEIEYRYSYASDQDIALAHLTSFGAPLRSALFIDESAANTEAERLIGFYGLRSAMFRVRVKGALFSIEIGQTVRLTYNRWNLNNGRNFVVTGVDDDGDPLETELLLFGG